ncbi:MAG: TetR/AcrR family transcriptional regulator [Bacteroidales bacterium]|jgi:AcrR family transcriptional regulator|nr:TetR/AcrR family transcriptional regulator [Bacteroidales bacterium]
MDYRQRIIDEAAEMFRTYGIRAITMDMLASQMGISKRTIYEVFSDKDELLAGVLKSMAHKQKELIDRVLGESANVIEALFKLLDLTMEHFSKMSPAFKLDIKKYHQDLAGKLDQSDSLPYVKNNEMIIERGIREGLFRKDIDVKIINRCMLEVAKMSTDREIFPPDDFASSEVIRNVYINYLRGLCTPAGLDLIDHYETKRKQKNI